MSPYLVLFSYVLPVVGIAVWVWAILDFVKTRIPRRSTRILWALIVFVGNILGSILWLAWGRRNLDAIEQL
ncbi:PLDc N-terminal domain-containing protein [Jonesia quinghaiensis]|uniref:PLDc N-terminal domain-containing protein n=1 Tax=Jonesia quinghaiensis TaxID=262806 RepID=UPI00040F36EC|nr:PLDc N-terminal domain-containing protein [Jonesia quinghaiensis]